MTTAPPALASQVPLSDPDAARAEFPTLAVMQARSADSVLCQQDRPGDATPGSNGAATERQHSAMPEASSLPTTHPSPAPSRPGPAAEHMHTERDKNVPGNTPWRGTLAARDKEIMPPPPPRLPHSEDPLGLEELRKAYDVYHRTP